MNTNKVWAFESLEKKKRLKNILPYLEQRNHAKLYDYFLLAIKETSGANMHKCWNTPFKNQDPIMLIQSGNLSLGKRDGFF